MQLLYQLDAAGNCRIFLANLKEWFVQVQQNDAATSMVLQRHLQKHARRQRFLKWHLPCTNGNAGQTKVIF